jgi:pilus assembly protein Flp/PilA
LDKEIRLMLKFYVKASDLLDRLRTDKDGVVSFEYIVVAALVIAAVGAAYQTGATNIQGVLVAGVGTLATNFTAAL